MQLFDEALEHHGKCQKFEQELNTKSTQTINISKSVGTQALPETKDTGIQTIETFSNTWNNTSEYDCDVSDEEPPHDLDSSFIATESSDSDDNLGNNDTEKNNGIKHSAFIVFWSSLMTLFSRCFTCFGKIVSLKGRTRGSLLIINTVCSNGHTFIWKSQPSIKRQFYGNIRLSAAVLFSANTFAKMAEYFRLADIQWIGKTRFYSFQKKYVAGVVNEAYTKSKVILLNMLKQKGPCQLCGDGRCDSPGRNAKYMTYSMLDQETNNVISMSMTQVTEAGNSNNMEKMGFIKVLNELKEKIEIKQITTDRHKQVRKYLREHEKEIDHQFDLWHFCKNIRKKLLAAAKKKPCALLNDWIKSICNHLWWCCASCEGDETLLREKWTSILFHVQNKHKWSSCTKFHKCTHPIINKKDERNKNWLIPDSDAFIALQKIVLDKNTLKDLKHLTKFSHTGKLEVYHALYNKWIPKSQHFSYLGMVTRSQLAIMDFNSGSDLEQAKTREGKDRHNVVFSKVTQLWQAKPIKDKKSRDFLSKLIDRTLEVIKEGEILDLPKLPSNLPENIAPIPKPNKGEVIKKQRSRFL